MNSFLNLVFFWALILVPAMAIGRDEPINENPVTLQIRLIPDRVSAGADAEIVIDMRVAPKHHAYRDMMKLKWASTETVRLDPFEVKPVKKFMDKFTGRVREGVEGSGRVTAQVHFPASMIAGSHQGHVDFTYQACSEKYCLFPKTLTLDFPFSITAYETASANAPSNTLARDETSDFQKAMAKGTIWAFLFVFVAGFLTSFTPCVFPMIPITISIIGARSVQDKKSRAFALSLSYVLGIALTYSLLGVFAAVTGAFFGSALSNIYVVSAIAVIFVIMGFSMLGMFEVQVPAFIRNRVGTASTGSGLRGAFLAGLFAGIVASPCIGPVLVSILTFVAQTSKPIFGFFLLFCFAIGMGIPFIVLGTFSGLLSKLPKAGPWMDSIKVVFGITFVGLALYYLYPVVSRNVFLAATALLLLFLTSYLGAWAPSPTTALKQVKKGMLIAGFFIGVFLITAVITSYMGIFTTVPEFTKSGISSSSHAKPHMEWQKYDESAVVSTTKAHRAVIIDFSADWCVACHELDDVTYQDPSVIDESLKFGLFKVDATNITAETDKLQKQYKIIGLPTVIFIDASGKIRDDVTVTGFVKPSDFLARMRKTRQSP